MALSDTHAMGEGNGGAPRRCSLPRQYEKVPASTRGIPGTLLRVLYDAVPVVRTIPGTRFPGV